MRFFPVFVGLAIGATAAGVAGHLAARRWLPAGETLPGLRIAGEPVGESVRATVQKHAEELAARAVAFRLDGRVVAQARLGELGVRVREDDTETLAKTLGRHGDWMERARLADAARRGDVDVPLSLDLEHDRAVRWLTAIKETEDTTPVAARLDLAQRTVVPERSGRYIDVDGTLAAILQAARDPAKAAVDLPTVSVPPRVSSQFLKHLEIGTVLADYETHFSRSGDQRLRGKNIDNGAAKLDGHVFMPGEVFSFNAAVGERSEENGFQKAWEIFKGEMVEGIGGGTCQVASTLHAAALFAGFDVLERLPHSRPSAYIPMGLDSTVVYPSVDLKLKNPHPFPVVLHAKTEGNKLRVELLGATKAVRVSFGREVLERSTFERRVVEDDRLSGNKVLFKQHGIRGYKIRRIRTLVFADGRKKVEKQSDEYPPTTEIVHVPPGFDPSVLPPVPDENDGAPTPPAVALCQGNCPQPDVPSPFELVEAPGAHAPTASQAHPSKSLVISR